MQVWKPIAHLALIAFIGFFLGCAHDVDTHHTTTTTPGVSGTTTTVVDRETTVVETEDANILSRTVDIIGAIIALPFRLVAGLFDLVF